MRRGHPLLSNLPNRLRALKPKAKYERPSAEPVFAPEKEQGKLWDRFRRIQRSDYE